MVPVLTILSALTFVLLVHATPSSAPGNLVARQSFASRLPDPQSLPSPCRETCQAVKTELSSCTNIACICSENVADDFASCLTCATAVENSPTSVTAGQTLIDEYVATCRAGGFSVGPATEFHIGASSSSSPAPASTPTSPATGLGVGNAGASPGTPTSSAIQNKALLGTGALGAIAFVFVLL